MHHLEKIEVFGFEKWLFDYEFASSHAFLGPHFQFSSHHNPQVSNAIWITLWVFPFSHSLAYFLGVIVTLILHPPLYTNLHLTHLLVFTFIPLLIITDTNASVSSQKGDNLFSYRFFWWKSLHILQFSPYFFPLHITPSSRWWHVPSRIYLSLLYTTSLARQPLLSYF